MTRRFIAPRLDGTPSNWSRQKALGCLILISFLFATLFCGCTKPEEPPEKKPQPIAAETFSVAKKPLLRTLDFPGRIQAKRQVTLSSKITGQVTAVMVEEGTTVRQGDLLLTIDDRELRKKIESLQNRQQQVEEEKKSLVAKTVYAARHYQRFRRLLREQAVTREEFDRARADYDALRKQQEALKSQIKAIESQIEELNALASYASVRSPCDGQVIRKMVYAGSFANAGQPLLTLDDNQAGFWFEASIDESLLASAKQGREIPVSVPSLKTEFLPPLAVVIKSVNSATRTFEVKLDLGTKNVRSGLFGRLLWPVDESQAILIPSKIIVRRGDLQAVYVIDDKHVIHFRLIRTGARFSEKHFGERTLWIPITANRDFTSATDTDEPWVEVLSGLTQGEILVASNFDMVSEGMVLQ